MDPIPEKRLRLYKVDRLYACNVRSIQDNPVSLRKRFPQLPSDAVVVDFQQAEASGHLLLKISSKIFRPIPEGQAIPIEPMPLIPANGV